MPRRYSRRGVNIEPATVSLIPAMSLFAIVVPMLLMTAVFEKVTVFNAKLPASASFEPYKEDPDPTGVEELQVWLSDAGMKVHLRSYGLEGEQKDVYREEEWELANLEDGKPDLDGLAQRIVEIKARFPKHKKAVVVCDNDVRYEAIIGVMDAVRERPRLDEATNHWTFDELFPDLSLSQRFLEEMFLTTPEEKKK